MPAVQWGGELHARISHAIFRFTNDQDVRLTAGVRAPVTQQASFTALAAVLLRGCWQHCSFQAQAGSLASGDMCFAACCDCEAWPCKHWTQERTKDGD
jgi:hypothetical protein